MLQLAGNTERQRIVAGSEEHAIDAVHLGDGLEVVHRLGILDLVERKPLPIGGLQIVGEPDAGVLRVIIATIEGALAERRELGDVADASRILSAHHMRHHQRRRVGLVGAHIVAVAAARHAHDRIDVVEFGGADLVLDGFERSRHMLLADPDGIGLRRREDLRHLGVIGVELEHARHLALADFAQDAAGAHAEAAGGCSVGLSVGHARSSCWQLRYLAV